MELVTSEKGGALTWGVALTVRVLHLHLLPGCTLATCSRRIELDGISFGSEVEGAPVRVLSDAATAPSLRLKGRLATAHSHD